MIPQSCLEPVDCLDRPAAAPSLPKVFLGLPLYSSQIHVAAARAALTHATRGGEFELAYRVRTGSLLTWVFNRLWADALNSDADYFAMLHGDIVPEDYWLDELFAILQDHEADVVSCVVPIKNDFGMTSTAIDDPENPWKPRRLTTKETARLPDVFSACDVHYANGWEGPFGGLLANTGCWIADLRRPWVRRRDAGSPFLAHSFVQLDGVFLDAEGQAQVCTSSEDWNFSRGVNTAGGRVLATTRIALRHVGDFAYPSDRAWGQERDEHYFTED